MVEKFQEDFLNESIYDTYEEFAPDLNYVFHECYWQQEKINCSDYMTSVLTPLGRCFAFNAFNSYDMFTDQ